MANHQDLHILEEDLLLVAKQALHLVEGTALQHSQRQGQPTDFSLVICIVIGFMFQTITTVGNQAIICNFGHHCYYIHNPEDMYE